MVAVQLPKTLNVVAYNTHLFGRTGMVDNRETGLIFQDERRAEQIADRLRLLDCDIVGLGEVWDDELRRGIISQLADIYPYRITTPACRGIQDIVDSLEQNWPRTKALLFDRVENVVDVFARSHYKTGNHFLWSALRYVVQEDWIAWLLRHVLSLPQAWGSGLLLLSKHEVSNAEFHLFPDAADLERFAQKGVLKADVMLPQVGLFTVFLTHLQEGKSRRARLARRRQEGYLQGLVDKTENPKAVLGDFNVDAEDREYQILSSRLGLTDSFLATHPEPRAGEGFTYDHDNPFAQRLGIQRARGQGRSRIDYIFNGPQLRALKSQVYYEEFQDERDGYYLSDHFPVAAYLSLLG